MKFIPILYSTPMVLAIIEDRKTKTRRTKGLEFINESCSNWEYLGVDELGYLMRNEHGATNAIKCPYGQPGDIHWVRETWQYVDFAGDDNGYVYRATDPDWETMEEWTWKPSLFMPKEACRIWLQITNVRVERLQDITDEDAIAEGIDYVVDKITGYCGYDYIYRTYNTMTTPYHGFRSLWRKINGEQSWNDNHWVWVIDFKKVDKPEGFS